MKNGFYQYSDEEQKYMLSQLKIEVFYFFLNLTEEWNNYSCMDLGLSCSVLLSICAQTNLFYLVFSHLNNFWSECVVAICYMWFKCCLYGTTGFVPVVSEDRGSYWECQAEMVSLEVSIPPGIQLGGWVIETDWGKKRMGVDAFYPQSEGFLVHYAFGILRMSFLASLWFGYKPTALVLWNPDWTFSSVCLLFLLVTVSKNILEFRDLNSKGVHRCLASTPALLAPVT